MIRLLSLLLFFSLLTAGCHTHSVHEMKDHADYGREIFIPENYQAVYRGVDDELSRCLTHKNAFPGQGKKWESNLYPEIRKGEIIFEKRLGIKLYMLIESIDDQNTRVRLPADKTRISRQTGL